MSLRRRRDASSPERQDRARWGGGSYRGFPRRVAKLRVLGMAPGLAKGEMNLQADPGDTPSTGTSFPRKLQDVERKRPQYWTVMFTFGGSPLHTPTLVFAFPKSCSRVQNQEAVIPVWLRKCVSLSQHRTPLEESQRELNVLTQMKHPYS